MTIVGKKKNAEELEQKQLKNIVKLDGDFCLIKIENSDVCKWVKIKKGMPVKHG